MNEEVIFTLKVYQIIALSMLGGAALMFLLGLAAEKFNLKKFIKDKL